MFEYENLYNTKMLGKTCHIRRWKYLQQYAPCSKSEGGTPNPHPYPSNTVFYIPFYPVKFQESKYSSQLFDLSFFKDMFFKQIKLIYY